MQKNKNEGLTKGLTHTTSANSVTPPSEEKNKTKQTTTTKAKVYCTQVYCRSMEGTDHEEDHFEFEEEHVALETVRESLEEAWAYFHSGKQLVSAQGASPTLPPPTIEQAHELLDVYYELLQTVQTGNNPSQRAFVVDASIRLRGDDPSPSLSPLHGGAAEAFHGVLPVLANFAVHSMSYAPEILDAGGSLTEAFGELRAHALQCIKAIILLAAGAEDEALAAMEAEAEAEEAARGRVPNQKRAAELSVMAYGIGCASRCTSSLIRLSLPEDLLVSVLPSSNSFNEKVRIAACEVLFAFAFRLPSAVQSLIVVQGVPRLLLRLGAEPSPTVKVFICSILRLIVTEVPEEAIGDGTAQMQEVSVHVGNASSASVVSSFVDLLLNENELDDIRVMAAEVLSSACKTRVGAVQLLTTDNSLLSDLLLLARFTIASPESPPVVVEALCKLIEAMVIGASSLRVVPFFELVVSMEFEKPLSQNLRRPRAEVHVAASAARGLRHLLQWSPPAYNLGRAIITTFPTLSVILKTLLECDKESLSVSSAEGSVLNEEGSRSAGATASSSSSDFALHQQVLSVELALCVSLMMAQSPFARSHIRSELSSYPSWSQSLLEATAKFLNAPTLEYYASIDIVDVGGFCINSLHSVSWSEGGKPLKSSVRKLFEDQRERVEQRVVAAGGLEHFPKTTSAGAASGYPLLRGGGGVGGSAPPQSAEEVKARARLTFVLLNFAMALALEASEEEEAAGRAVPTSAGGSHLNTTPGIGAADLTGATIAATTPRGGRGGGLAAARKGSSLSVPLVGPNASRLASAGVPAVRPALSRQEKELLMFAYDKFDSAFKLVLQFAKHYEKKERQEATYVPTADGYVVRQAQLKNPWATIVKRRRTLSWAVPDVKEGDLFYFAVPYEELSYKAVESLILSLRRHMTSVKKSLVITPQGAKGRRSLLYDLQENVLPKTMDLLRRLADLLDSRGENTVRFPIFLFRERELHVGERCLHSGILPQVMDQVEYYFMQSAEEQSAMQLRPDLTANIDAKIAALKARTFTGLEESVGMPDSDDDERVPGRGHGGISSDSD